MTTPTQQLRDRILTSTHVPIGVGGLLLKMVELIFAQQTEIDEQQAQIADLRQTISNQYARHDNQVAQLRKDIQKLSGVHGA